MKSGTTLNIEGKSVAVSNLDKIYYPETGFTKGEMIDYYIKVSPVLLKHLANRPLSMKRYPDGVDGFFFYEKQCPQHRPDWMRTKRVSKSDGGAINYCTIDDLASLVWTANLANLELHPFLHRAAAINRPEAVAFDLDPGPPANILDCCKVGLIIRDLLSEMNLQCFAKTSGSKGLQVYVPLNTPVTYAKTKPFAHAVARLLEKKFPQLVVSRMQKTLRKSKVLVDWSQNDAKKTTVCVYSLRAKSEPTVSTPVTWDEVERSVRSRKPLSFQASEVLKRIKKHGDLFAPVLELKQKLPTNSFQA